MWYWIITMGIWKTSLFIRNFKIKVLALPLVNKLLEEAERMGLEIVIRTYVAEHKGFYEKGRIIPVQVDSGENSHIPAQY